MPCVHLDWAAGTNVFLARSYHWAVLRAMALLPDVEVFPSLGNSVSLNSSFKRKINFYFI